MPGYRKTKPVSAEKIEAQAGEERKYQSGYAKKRLKAHTESYRATGKGTLTKKGKAVMTRVSKSTDPGSPTTGTNKSGSYASIAGELLGEVKRLAQKTKENYEKFKSLGE